jgi:hypothetical protein
MNKRFDRRVLPASVLDFVRAAQDCMPCHLGGGAALAGAYLGHRTTGDIDLFVHGDRASHRELVELLLAQPAPAARVTTVRDAGHLVRLQLTTTDATLEVDVIHEPVADLTSEQPVLEGIVVESLVDLRANKLVCILSRSEPRDLVDLLFLDRMGFPPEQDMELALRKDAGIDPAILAWLLARFPLEPLPMMLQSLTVDDLRAYRDQLAERLRQLSA